MSPGGRASRANEVCESAIFVQLLRDNKILFSKDRSVDMQQLKERALEAVRVGFNRRTKQNLNIKQVKKKLNNFKIRVPEAAEKVRSGCLRRSLKEWEVDFLELNGLDEKTQEVIEKSTCISKVESEVTSDSTQLLLEHTLEVPTSHLDEDDINSKVENSSYESLDTETLKRMLLIAQIRAAEAQERAAWAQERAAIAEEAVSIIKKRSLLETPPVNK